MDVVRPSVGLPPTFFPCFAASRFETLTSISVSTEAAGALSHIPTISGGEA